MSRTARTAPREPRVTLHELPVAQPGDRVVFVTNAVRRRGGLRRRADQHRPVLAVVLD